MGEIYGMASMQVASTVNLWVWLKCIGVFSVFFVRRYMDILIIIITFPYSTCISSFLDSSIRTTLFIFKMYLFMLFLCNIVIANVA